MKIHIKNSEQEFINFIKEHEDKNFGYRAMLIKLSISNVKSNDTTRQIISKLSKALEGINASIFLFKDYDIIVCYQGLSIKLSEKIINYLEQVINMEAEKLISIYDLEKSNKILSNICNKKIELQQLEESAKQQSQNEIIQEAEKTKEPLNFEVNQELLSTLKKRKKENDKTKILLVEDDSFSRRMVKNIISKDYEIIEAGSGQDALSKYLINAPNIVFLDINLPDCTGMEVLERLISYDDKSYVVMLSGNSFKDNILMSVKRGAKGFIGKPFPKDKIYNYLERYEQEKYTK